MSPVSKICRKTDSHFLRTEIDTGKIWVYTVNMKDLHPIIAENLAALRKASGLTQAQLAERLDYSDKAVSRWEKGDTLPDINVLYELCDFYGISMNTLLEKGGGADAKPLKDRSSIQYAAVCALAIAIVWLIATVLYVYLLTESHFNFWQVFIWAVPVSCLVVLYMNRRFRSRVLQFITATVFAWTLLTAIYLQLLSHNIWLVFIVGVPVQVICVLWFVIKRYK